MNITVETTTNAFVYKPPFNEFGATLTAIIVIPLCVFGVLANITTIIVISTSKKLQSTFNFLILSLSVSDLMSSLISPFFLYRRTWGFNIWMWSDFMCKVAWGVDFWSNYVTSFHILIFAILRFIAIQWPHFRTLSLIRTKIMIAVVWIVSFGIGFIPMAIWLGATARDRSSSSPTSKWPSCTLNIEWIREFKLYTFIVYPLCFYIPILLVTLLSVGIAVKLFITRRTRSAMISNRNSNNGESAEGKRRRKENQIILQLGLIVGSFLVGYVPRSVFHFYTVRVPARSYEARVFDWWFGTLVYFSLRISECLNPIFYNVASSKMRRETKKTLKRFWLTLTGCCVKEKHSPVSSSASSDPNNTDL